MKTFVILSTLLAYAFAEKIKYYTTGNDYLDVDEAMKKPELVKSLIQCYVDLGPCTALSQSYKDIMPEAIPTACYRCNDPQKHMWSRFLWGLKALYPDLYTIYQEKYDPHKIYLEALAKVVEGY